MSATDPAPPPEPASAETAPERAAARNPWLWATAGIAVLAIALGIWGLPGALAAVAAAFTMLEIVGGIPQAGSVDEGLNQAADRVTALVPKGKDSVASAGG